MLVVGISGCEDFCWVRRKLFKCESVGYYINISIWNVDIIKMFMIHGEEGDYFHI